MRNKDLQNEVNELVQNAIQKAEQVTGQSKEFILDLAEKKDAKSVNLVVMFRRQCSDSLRKELEERDFSENNAFNNYMQENFVIGKANLEKQNLKPSELYMINTSFRFVGKYLLESEIFTKTENAVNHYNKLIFYIDGKNVLATDVIDFNEENIEDKRFFIIEDNDELKIAASCGGDIYWSSKEELEKTIQQEEEKLNKAKNILSMFLKSTAKKNKL